MPSAIPQTALTLPLYKKNELVKELRQSILPWGILELAIDLQEVFGDAQTDEENRLKPESMSLEGIQKLTDFVIYIFEDEVTREELNRQASLQDMFAVYAQIFTMVGQIMKSNPTIGQAINRQSNLKKPAPK
jgi:hypothetical protein